MLWGIQSAARIVTRPAAKRSRALPCCGHLQRSSGYAAAVQEVQAEEALRLIAWMHGIKLGMDLSSEN